MSWATPHIKKLQEGESVQFRPRGGSMKGKVESGQLVTVEPVGEHKLEVGSIVLCKVSGSHYLHLIKAVQEGDKPRYQIGNNKGHINGWTSTIYGVCTKVED